MRKLKQIIIPLERVMEIDKIEDFNTRIHMAARLYSELGIRIVPLRPGTKILPAKQTGVNYFSGSSKLTVIEKWFGPGGRYWGWNIGAVCGEHLFIIDLDMHGSINGIEAWDKFKGPNEILCPIAMTPTGGRHLFLKWAKNLTSSTAKLAPGIDTRGGDGSPRSHAVLWPSKTPDGTYSWIQGGELPDTPTWVVDKMGVPWSSNQSEGRGNEEVGLEHEEYRYDIGRIAIMLEHVDPNVLSYEEWVFVGQAINSQHSGSDGLKLWDTWSAVGKRHVPGECERRWTGFDPAGNIRMGSLIYLAKKGGYDASNDPVGEAEFQELTDRMNEDNAVLLTGGKIRIVHRDKASGIHIMNTQDFNTLMYNRKVELAAPTKGGNFTIKTVTEADIWMAHPDRRECIMGMGFFPDEELWHDGYVNLWRGWGVKPKEGDWSLFKTHILEVLCDSDEELNRFVLDWVADILQDPMNPKGTAIVMHGKEGTGKGTFCHMVGKIVGRHHYKHVTNERHLTGHFNSMFMESLLMFADEVIYGGSRSTAGILKSIVTEKELVCERKGLDTFMYENRTRLVVASNEDWFIPAGPESRRWLVLELNDKCANDKSYFNAIYNQMESGGYEAMMYDLQCRKITSNLNKAIETEALQSQRDIYRSTGDSVDVWMDERIGSRDLKVPGEGQDNWPDFVDRIALFESFIQWARNGKMRTKGNSHFYKKVENYGFVKFRPRVEKGEVRRWMYKVPPHDQLVAESRSDN